MSGKLKLKKTAQKQYSDLIDYIDNKEGIRDITRKN